MEQKIIFLNFVVHGHHLPARLKFKLNSRLYQLGSTPPSPTQHLIGRLVKTGPNFLSKMFGCNPSLLYMSYILFWWDYQHATDIQQQYLSQTCSSLNTTFFYFLTKKENKNYGTFPARRLGLCPRW
jgi:hypothetical protein